MQFFKRHIFQPLLESSRDLLPVISVILFFQIFILKQAIPNLPQLISGFAFVLIGLSLFMKGLNMGLFPIGEQLAYAFARKGSLFWLLSFAFLLGFSTTIAEPALIAICQKAAEIAADENIISTDQESLDSYAIGLRLTIAFSVGLAIVIGVLRILKAWSLPKLIIIGYVCVVIMTYFAPPEIIGLAYDSGGVTTSTITVPLVTALGVGLASSIKGRNPMLDGFGLIALSSLTPMIFVMMYGMLFS